jgi:hypothetical protein
MCAQLHATGLEETNTQTTESGWKSLYIVGGVAALTAGTLLLTAMTSLIISLLQPGATNSWLSLFENNWLIVIFKLHAGFSGIQIDRLHILNTLDLAILALVGTMHLGLYAAFRRTSRVWSIIALALPFMGIILFIATKTAGRSAVMGAGLVISGVMLRDTTFNRAAAYMGVAASVLLLVGDFSAGVLHSGIITTLFGIGYVLLTTWIFFVARMLLRLGRSTKG